MPAGKITRFYPPGPTKSGKQGPAMFQIDSTGEMKFSAWEGQMPTPLGVGDEINFMADPNESYGKHAVVNQTAVEVTKKASPAEATAMTNVVDGGKDRSFALSYAKDLMVAMIANGIDASVATEETIAIAKKFLTFLDGEEANESPYGQGGPPPEDPGDNIPF